MKHIHIIGLLVSLFLATACKKAKDGVPGPQGAQGNANVVTKTITVNSWTPLTQNGITMRFCNIATPSITQAIADNGSVAVYLVTSNTKESIGLPFTFPNGKSGITSTLQYGYLPNEVSLSVVSSDGSDPGDLGAMTIKVVTTAGAN